VRAIDGYILDTAGRRWAVVCLINHPKVNNASARPIFDALLQWVHSAPGNGAMRPADK
jgi:D-alanyl-D-alanine carboxypeptidase/D-alanyl-D-alanine-endopeptidase (penicillin-binding protein 4)